MIKKNIEIIQGKIRARAHAVGRNPADITLVCITKFRSLEEIGQVLESGIVHCGENKVQEALEKISALRTTQYASRIQWHMVGHLQTNKAKKALELFDIIQSVDSVHLAQKIDALSKEANRVADILVEVKVSDEATKFGIPQVELKNFIKEISTLEHIRVKGLMAMAPVVADKEEARPYFRQLRKLQEEIRSDKEIMSHKTIILEHLSMGMSQDYEIAVEEGATMLRIGTAIFKGAQ